MRRRTFSSLFSLIFVNLDSKLPKFSFNFHKFRVSCDQGEVVNPKTSNITFSRDSSAEKGVGVSVSAESSTWNIEGCGGGVFRDALSWGSGMRRAEGLRERATHMHMWYADLHMGENLGLENGLCDSTLVPALRYSK